MLVASCASRLRLTPPPLGEHGQKAQHLPPSPGNCSPRGSGAGAAGESGAESVF